MLQMTRVRSYAQTDTHAHERIRNEVVLVARLLLVVLFLVFGWSKLTDYAGTVGYMTQIGAPLPSLAALVAIVVEVFAALAVALGLWTRPLALLLALYTLGTALIGHPFWMMEGADRTRSTSTRTSASSAASSCSTSPARAGTRSTRGGSKTPES